MSQSIYRCGKLLFYQIGTSGMIMIVFKVRSGDRVVLLFFLD